MPLDSVESLTYSYLTNRRLLNVFLVFSDCSCDSRGSYTSNCDPITGVCQCKRNVIGKKCAQCAPGLVGFPFCAQCTCNPVGTKVLRGDAGASCIGISEVLKTIFLLLLFCFYICSSLLFLSCVLLGNFCSFYAHTALWRRGQRFSLVVILSSSSRHTFVKLSSYFRQAFVNFSSSPLRHAFVILLSGMLSSSSRLTFEVSLFLNAILFMQSFLSPFFSEISKYFSILAKFQVF